MIPTRMFGAAFVVPSTPSEPTSMWLVALVSLTAFLALGTLFALSITARERAVVAQQAPIAESAKPKLPVIQPSCHTCAHFDYEYGQTVMKSHAPFMAASEALTPAEMGHGYVYDDAGERAGINCTDKKTLTARWSEFGACMHDEHMELRSRRDVCDLFTLKSDV